MLFNSLTYVFFLPLVVAVTWFLRPALRPVFLLLASYVFYADWSPPYLALIIGMTVVNYLLGRVRPISRSRRRALLASALVFNLGTLAIFKYLGLLDSTALSLAHAVGLQASFAVTRLILPLGLSFFTFEFIHYQVDLYRGTAPIRSPIEFALFPAFFPTQIAGPIKRYEDFQAQVQSRPPFDPTRFLEGVELVALGMFKKVVLADTMLPIADAVFAHHAQAGVVDTWVGALAFSFQIYLDFSGYTDIGRGSAQLLGYVVPKNFDAPYLATSFRDFWRRWHMSLSSWLRDYLYIPLGGNRQGPWGTRFNLLVTMALGGLWHGAAWHFVAWGIGHGLALVVSRDRLGPVAWRLPKAVEIGAGWVLTQLVVLQLWVLFRAPSASAALDVWRHMFGLSYGGTVLEPFDRWVVVGIATAVVTAQLVLRRLKPRKLLALSPAGVILRPAYVYALILVAAQFASLESVVHRFIYFQF